MRGSGELEVSKAGLVFALSGVDGPDEGRAVRATGARAGSSACLAEPEKAFWSPEQRGEQ